METNKRGGFSQGTLLGTLGSLASPSRTLNSVTRLCVVKSFSSSDTFPSIKKKKCKTYSWALKQGALSALKLQTFSPVVTRDSHVKLPTVLI